MRLTASVVLFANYEPREKNVIDYYSIRILYSWWGEPEVFPITAQERKALSFYIQLVKDGRLE